MILRR